MAKIFNKNFFIGVGVGILITILIIMVGGYLFIWWYSSAKISAGQNWMMTKASLF